MIVRERLGLVMATVCSCSALFLAFSAGDLTIESSFLSKEADLRRRRRVAPDEAHNHRFLLSPLETVYTTAFDAGESFLQFMSHQSKLHESV